MAVAVRQQGTTVSDTKYLDIVDIIRARVASGDYPKGSKLPTHRALAQELATTPATIAKAYKVLIEQKEIESFVGRGTFVRSDTRLEQVIHSRQDDQVLNLSILQPCIAYNIDRLTNKISSCLGNITEPDLFGYTEHTGLLRHRESGMEWARHYGLEIASTDQMLLANGAQHALSSLIQLYTKPGDTIAVEAQTYPGILSIAHLLGRRLAGVTMDGQGMLPEALEALCQQQKIAMVIVLPSHQNPTGATMSEQRRTSLATVIERFRLWLVEDDIYGFLNENRREAITNRVPQLGFHISGLSKAISPGLRCAYIRAPASQAAHLAAFIRATIWLPPPLMFEVASGLIRSGDAYQMAKAQQDIARRRQRIARDILNDYPMSSQPTSYHLWLHLPDSWQADSLALAAREQNMLVSSASFFRVGPQSDNAVRLSLMSIADESQYRYALEKLAGLLEAGSAVYGHF